MTKKVIARAPATCGEYIQGIYNGLPCLVSSPVELYSKTLVTSGTGKNNLREKARKAVLLLLEEENIDTNVLEKLDILTETEVKTGIGMASSTSDIVSALSAVGAFLRIDLTPERLSRICIQIEPSDNLMYEDLNLYNHYTGEVFTDYKARLKIPITLVEFTDFVDTVEFGYETEFKKSESDFKRVLEDFSEAVREGDVAKLARATTMSARMNQEALYKDHLESMIEHSRDCGGLGVLIGHSGSVFGIIEGEDFDFNKFKDGLPAASKGHPYDRVFETNLTSGGVRIETTES